MNDHVSWELVKKLRTEYDYQLASILGRLRLLELVFSVKLAVDITLADFIAGDFRGYSAIQLRADVNGQPGYFVSVAAGPAHDGALYIVDSHGTTFQRRSLV